jgi:threonine synthase
MNEAHPLLISTRTGSQFSFSRLEEFAPDGSSLEVSDEQTAGGSLRSGKHLWERFADFLPFASPDPLVSLGEGNTPLLPAPPSIAATTGAHHVLLKNETQNPTWSFKDRGSLTCIWMARLMGEQITATISTGNMGHSIAAYAAHAGLRAVVFAPSFVPEEKLRPMAVHGATVIRVAMADYASMKDRVLALGAELGIRIVSGNGPVRVEGYKSTAFELLEQMNGEVPDWIVVPTSACGHLRGIFKGYRELMASGLTGRLPRMVIVQATNNSPIVSAIKQGSDRVIPFTGIHTIAEAITSGNPPGGDELIAKARRYEWLAEDVSEEEIAAGQDALAAAGLFVESAAATGIPAVRKLVAAGRIAPEERVVVMLTGTGLKDAQAGAHAAAAPVDTDEHNLRADAERVIFAARRSISH